MRLKETCTGTWMPLSKFVSLQKSTKSLQNNSTKQDSSSLCFLLWLTKMVSLTDWLQGTSISMCLLQTQPPICLFTKHKCFPLVFLHSLPSPTWNAAACWQMEAWTDGQENPSSVRFTSAVRQSPWGGNLGTLTEIFWTSYDPRNKNKLPGPL